eukprot:3495231-Amphidinium_carterae.1
MLLVANNVHIVNQNAPRQIENEPPHTEMVSAAIIGKRNSPKHHNGWMALFTTRETFATQIISWRVNCPNVRGVCDVSRIDGTKRTTIAS